MTTVAFTLLDLEFKRGGLISVHNMLEILNREATQHFQQDKSLEAVMTHNSFLKFPGICHFLALLGVIAFVHLTACVAMAGETRVGPYDSSKFEPISMIETLPLFKVEDQRPSEQVLFKIRYRTSIPPVEYFRDGLQDSIAQSSAVIQDDGRELQFIIKDFRVVGESQHSKTVNLTSTIEVDVLIKDNGKNIEIGNYKTTYYGTSERDPSGMAVSDIQYVIDQNFHKLLDKIFKDRSFIGAVKKTP
jgi:hypothetical protein